MKLRKVLAPIPNVEAFQRRDFTIQGFDGTLLGVLAIEKIIALDPFVLLVGFFWSFASSPAQILTVKTVRFGWGAEPEVKGGMCPPP
ncbi:MAG: hypothetical protein AAGM84_06730 [Pseudomonadota bacterium]